MIPNCTTITIWNYPTRISSWYGDQESEKRDSPFLDQTILRAGGKQDQFPTQTDEVTTPLTQFTQNIMGTLVVTVKPKAKTTQTKTSTQQMPNTA